jgi:mannose/fructose/N-acetylgalactosamine-specific phosphotransferase system component IIB
MMGEDMSSIYWARSDDRLIHGQVTVGWRQHLRYETICVVDDVTAADPALRDALRLAAPAGVAVHVYTTAEAAAALAPSPPEKTLLLLKSPQTALALVEGGVSLSRLNVGNLAARPGSVRVLQSISLTIDHVAVLDALAARGTEVTFQPTPSDAPVEWQVLRQRCFG